MENKIVTRRTIILRVLNILKEQTNQEHILSSLNICDLIKKENINCSLSQVRTSIDSLRDFGFDIVAVKSKGYYFNSPDFVLQEVYVIVEALKKANFNVEKEYIDFLIKKVKKLLNIYDKDKLETLNMII